MMAVHADLSIEKSACRVDWSLDCEYLTFGANKNAILVADIAQCVDIKWAFIALLRGRARSDPLQRGCAGGSCLAKELSIMLPFIRRRACSGHYPSIEQVRSEEGASRTQVLHRGSAAASLHICRSRVVCSFSLRIQRLLSHLCYWEGCSSLELMIGATLAVRRCVDCHIRKGR